MPEAVTISPQAKTTEAAATRDVMPLQEQFVNSKNSLRFIQPKLTVGAPDDPYEKEADDVADKVMRMPVQNFIQRKCADCAEESVHMKSHTVPVIPFIQRVPSTPSTTSQSTTPAIAAPQVRNRPTGVISRQEFDTYVQTYYGVTDVHTGTQTEQEGRITRRGVPAPSIPTWQAWDPGSSSEDYTSIVDGMEDVISSLGAMPQVARIIFFKVAYEPDTTTGVGIPQPDTGASFGAGELVIYDAFTGSTRPATGISTAQGTPTRTRSRSADISYNIIHELGHGVGEAGSNNGRQMFDEYNAAVGWIGNPAVLYDVGQPAVRAAIANSTTLPPPRRSTCRSE